MQSSGGVMSWASSGEHAAWTVLSGPAAGAVGAAQIGLAAGEENVLSFDMGGTSCDVAVVDGGRVRQTLDRTMAGPACYGKGGEDATVTDANLALGYLDAGTELPGGLAIDVDAAERALERLGEAAGLS